MTQVLSLVRSLPRGESNFFPEYIFPAITEVAQDEVVCVRVAFAESLSSLAGNFVQLEGTKSDCSKYWASITVASFNPYTASQVCQTARPTPLDLHCRDDLQSIGEAIVMTEKVVVSVLQYDTLMSRYQFKVEVKIMHNNEVAEQGQQII